MDRREGEPMSHCRRTSLLIAIACLYGFTRGAAAEPAPLPPGAIARLGTALLRHEGDIRSVSFAPDGKTVAAGTLGALCVWDVATGKEVTRIRKAGALFSPLRFSHDGKLLAAVESDGIRLWDPTNGQQDRHLPLKFRRASDMQFSADGATLTLIADDGVRILDLATGKETTLDFHPGDDARLSPTAKHMVDAEGRGLRLRNLPAGDKHEPLIVPDRVLGTPAFTADGLTLAAGASDRAIHFFDIATSKETRKLATEYGSLPACVALSADGKVVASAGWTKPRQVGGEFVLHLRAADTGKEIARTRVTPNITAAAIPITDLAFAPDGKTLAGWGGGSARLFLWDAATGKPLHPAESPDGAVDTIAFDADGKTLATVSHRECIVRLWDAASGKPLRELTGSADAILAIAFSPDATVLAAGCEDGTIRLWDPATGKPIARLTGHNKPVTFVAFGPGGKTLVSAGSDNTARFWDVAARKEQRQITGESTVRALLPDGKTLLRSHKGRDLLSDYHDLYRLDNGETWRARLAAGRPSDDGKLIAGIDRVRRAVVFHEIGGHPTPGMLPVPVDGDWALAFAPDGKTLALGDAHADAIRLWDLKTRKERGRFAGRQGAITGLAFTADGKRLASAGRDGTTIIWDLAKPQPVEQPLNVERTDRELEALWNRMADGTEDDAYRAVWDMVGSPRSSVPFVEARLLLIAPENSIDRWIADLDSDKFDRRQRAVAELEKRVEWAETALRELLASKPPLELERRVTRILEKLPEKRNLVARERRAIEVLDLIDNAESRKHLEKLAKGPKEEPLTREAKAALERRKP